MKTYGITGTPAKLRNGNWGARVEGSPFVGQTARITTKSGKSWDAMISKIVWQGDGVALVETESLTPRRPAARGGWCRCGNHEDPMSTGFARYAGQTIKCPDCGGKIDVC